MKLKGYRKLIVTLVNAVIVGAIGFFTGDTETVIAAISALAGIAGFHAIGQSLVDRKEVDIKALAQSFELSDLEPLRDAIDSTIAKKLDQQGPQR